MPRKGAIGIAGRIWLSFAVLLIGYTILILQGTWMASYTEEKNNFITGYLFPAALTAQADLSSFKEQSRQFEEAVLFGEKGQLDQAREKTEQIVKDLRVMADNRELPSDIRQQAGELLGRYQRFLQQAVPLYEQMLTFQPDDDLLEQAARVRALSQGLLAGFVGLERNLSHKVQHQLQTVTSQSRRHREIGIMVFIFAVGGSLLFVSFIVNRSIIRPLRETVALANFMASGDLSRKLTIRRHDEIGELAKAMNIMAGELESYYADMEGKVRNRTQRLEQVNKHLRLEAEQRKRTQKELVKALEAARSSAAAKSAFLANMSHEIRTPLNGIIGMGYLLVASKLDATQQRYVSTITTSAESLLRILNDILDFSKVEAGKLQLEETHFNPHETIDHIVDIFAVQAQEKRINLITLVDATVPAAVRGDEGRLRQILLNLVGNAIKFTMDGGEVAIRVKVEERHGHDIIIRFSISDTGIGIPEEDMERLFQPFTQADASTTRKFGGTGLGLSISRHLVDLMGGTIKAESNQDEGSTFWFTVKLVALGAEGEEVEPTGEDHLLLYSESRKFGQDNGPGTADSYPHPDLRNKEILVVEDDATSTVVTEAILESFGCRIRTVTNGREAVTAVADHDFDLVLMDNQMPQLSGVEATQAIRRLRDSQDDVLVKRSEVTIIGLSADSSPSARQRFLNAGMDDSLTKPIRPEILHACLLQWLVRRSKAAQVLFSLEGLLRRYGGNEKAVADLLERAKHDLARHLATAKRACNDNEHTLLAQSCESIKQLAVDLGAASIQHLAIHICLAAAEDKCDLSLFRDFEEGIVQLIKNLDDAA